MMKSVHSGSSMVYHVRNDGKLWSVYRKPWLIWLITVTNGDEYRAWLFNITMVQMARLAQ